MGNWLTSTFLRFDSLFFSKNNKSIEYRTQGNQINLNSNPSFMVKVAAEIVALERMEANRSVRSDSEWSSDDDCPLLNKAEESRIFERERQIAFSGRLSVGDENSLQSLRDDITIKCGNNPSTSLAHLCISREIGSARGYGPMNNRVKTALFNSFVPNRRKRVEKVGTKTFCCKYANKGRMLVVASQDEVIRFYQKNSEHAKYSSQYVQCNQLKVNVCSWSILDVDVTENAETLAYSTWKDTIFLANLSELGLNDDNRISWHHIDLGENEHHTAVFCLRFSQNGKQIVCGSSDRCIHIFDVERKIRVRSIANAHEDDVNTVCFADDGSNLIFSSGDDGLVKVWDQRAWSDGDVDPVGIFAGHRDGVTYVDSRKDDRYLLSNCKDQTIKLWDLRKFSTKEGINQTRNCVKKQNWDYRWQPAPPGLCQPVTGDTSVMTLRGHNVLHTLVRAKFSPEITGKRYIYTGCARGEVVVYDMLTGVVSNRLKGHESVVRDVDWHPEENEIVSSSWDGVTSVWYWDEREDHITSPYDGAQMGDEDSCDELYNQIVHLPRKPKKTRANLKNNRIEAFNNDNQ